MPANRKLASGEGVRTVRTKPRPRPEALERDLLARLGRAEGQLRGLQRMVRANAYCIDVLQQISAVRRALDRLGLLLVQDHLKSCVSEAIAQENSPRKIKELVDALDRFLA